jgi:glycine cleavage system H protein
MGTDRPETLYYQRARFVTQLPGDYLYSPAHFWIARHRGNTWRAGLTKFATRKLGEIVEHGFEVELHAPVLAGQVIGWVEGFKAISDILCLVEGRFAGANPALKDRIGLINKDPYGMGWLYAVKGEPGGECVEARAYAKLLDQSIDECRKRQEAAE